MLIVNYNFKVQCAECRFLQKDMYAVVCSLCKVQKVYEICNTVSFVMFNVQCERCDVHVAMCVMLFAMYGMPFAMGNMQYAMCNMHCVMSNAQFAMFFVNIQHICILNKIQLQIRHSQRRQAVTSLILGPLHILFPLLGYLKKLYAIC
jgi:hypothetical protein